MAVAILRIGIEIQEGIGSKANNKTASTNVTRKFKQTCSQLWIREVRDSGFLVVDCSGLARRGAPNKKRYMFIESNRRTEP